MLCAQVGVALGAFLASSDSENADVECYSSVDGSELVDVAGCMFLTSFTPEVAANSFSLYRHVSSTVSCPRGILLVQRHPR